MIRKNKIVAFSTLILTFVLALIGFVMINKPVTSYATGTVEVPTNATLADASDFYIYNGASVKIDGDGIKFKTLVKKSYHDNLATQGVTYIATANAVGKGVIAKQIPFTGATDETGNYYELYTYILFDAEDESLYSVDFSVDTYAKVGATYYQAAGEVVRSMGEVGYSAWKNWTEESSYAKADVEKYFNAITQDNIDDAFPTATSGYWVLTEDIDMSSFTSWGNERGDYKTNYFKGQFDGDGHVINNFTNVSPGVASHKGAFLYSIDSATVKNVVFKNARVTKENAGVVAGRATNSTLKNVFVEVSMMGSYNNSSLLGPSENDIVLNNVTVYVKAVNTTPNAATGVLANSYFRSAKTRNLSIINVTAGTSTPVTSTPTHASITTVFKTLDGQERASDYLDTITFADIDTYLNSTAYTNSDAEFKTLINKACGLVELNQGNIDTLLTATSGRYTLTENVDLSGLTWAPTSTFSGTLDGQGFKISNLKGTLFNTIDGATICNLILDNVTSTANGVLCSAQLKKDVTLENVIVEVTSATAHRTSLLGIQVSGKATLKNVVVDMFAFDSNTQYKGFLTTNAGAVSILDKAYFIGGNGSLHSPGTPGGTENNSAYIPSYFQADGKTTAVENADYFIYDTVADFDTTGLDSEFKTMVNNFYNK